LAACCPRHDKCRRADMGTTARHVRAVAVHPSRSPSLQATTQPAARNHWPSIKSASSPLRNGRASPSSDVDRRSASMAGASLVTAARSSI
jgi:hypothetical protein